MTDEGKTEVLKNPNFLGYDPELVGPQAGNTKESGIRRLVSNPETQTQVRRTRIKGTEGFEQDVSSTSSSSNWKEYLKDNKHIKGVFLDNNILLWFESTPEVEEYTVANIVRDKYPDAKPVATFELAQRDDSAGESDLTIFSASDRQDVSLNPLVDYFGRSFGWRGDIKLEIRYADPEKQPIQTDFQEYLSNQ